MANRKRLINEDGEVRELTESDVKRMVGFASLPDSLKQTLSSRKRGPQKAPTKEMVSIRLSRDVVEEFRATGSGWQRRVDQALEQWLRKRNARRKA